MPDIRVKVNQWLCLVVAQTYSAFSVGRDTECVTIMSSISPCLGSGVVHIRIRALKTFLSSVLFGEPEPHPATPRGATLITICDKRLQKPSHRFIQCGCGRAITGMKCTTLSYGVCWCYGPFWVFLRCIAYLQQPAEVGKHVHMQHKSIGLGFKKAPSNFNLTTVGAGYKQLCLLHSGNALDVQVWHAFIFWQLVCTETSKLQAECMTQIYNGNNHDPPTTRYVVFECLSGVGLACQSSLTFTEGDPYSQNIAASSYQSSSQMKKPALSDNARPRKLQCLCRYTC